MSQDGMPSSQVSENSAIARFLSAVGAMQGQTQGAADAFANLLTEAGKTFSGNDAVLPLKPATTPKVQEAQQKSDGSTVKTARQTDSSEKEAPPARKESVDEAAQGAEPPAREDCKSQQATEERTEESELEDSETETVSEEEESAVVTQELAVVLTETEEDQAIVEETGEEQEEAPVLFVAARRLVKETKTQTEAMAKDDATDQVGEEEEDLAMVVPFAGALKDEPLRLKNKGLQAESAKTEGTKRATGSETPVVPLREKASEQEALAGSESGFSLEETAAKASEKGTEEKAAATESFLSAAGNEESAGKTRSSVAETFLRTTPAVASQETSAATNVQKGVVASTDANAVAVGGTAKTGGTHTAVVVGAFSRATSSRNGAAVEQIAAQVSKMVKKGQDEMTINLKPPELGKVQVKLSFSSDNKVQALITADSQNALDLLMKEQSSLSRALTDAGLQIDQGAMQFSLSENGQNTAFGEKGQQSNWGFSAQAENGASEIDEGGQEIYVLAPGRINIRV